jgi:branched-chain amino acid transport system substrate-binding protein
MSPRFRRRAAAIAVLALTAACAPPGQDGGAAGEAVTVGMILSYTGPYSTQAKNFENGFNAGLDYITKGTRTVAGHPVHVLKGDDTGQASVGTAKAREFLGKGATVLTGPTDSAIALAVAQQAVQNNALYIAGTSGTTATVGMDKRVFPTSGPSPAGQPIINKIIGNDPKGKRLAVIGQDVTFGQSQSTALEKQLTPLGVKVDKLLLPPTTSDFTPLAIQLKKLKPDFITSLWATAGATQLLSTLRAQGVLNEAQYFQFLFLSAGWPAIGEALGQRIGESVFYTTYFPGVTGNPADQALSAYSARHGHKVEYDDLVGFNAALMLARAVEKGGTADGGAMADALRGWSFTGPSGEVLIRAKDNQITLPGFTTRLVKQSDGSWKPRLLHAYPAKVIEPPVVKPLP